MSTIEKAAAKLRAKQVVKAPREPVGQVRAVGEESESLASALAGDAGVEPLGGQQGHTLTAHSDRPVVPRLTCTLNLPWLAENHFLVPDHENRAQAHEFRRIKRPLLLNLQPRVAAGLERPPSSIFITSALPGEGKTFVSLNLALSLAAELDRSVLLIDGDAAKGDLSRWLGIHDQPGLVDMLTSDCSETAKHIIDTNVDRLQVLSCGQKVEHLDELYSSKLMKSVVDEMCGEDPNRIVVVDGPPLLATTEAAVLAGQFGQVVLVVEANKTAQSAVESAAQQLADCQLVSGVLNKSAGSAGAGYGYGYGYGQGEKYERAFPTDTHEDDAA